MLEAVNSVLQTAPLVRANAEQVSSADSFAANPNRIQKVSQAPYVSPYYTVDATDNKIVLEIRNASTGAVLQTYPAETQISDSRAQVRQTTRYSSSNSSDDEQETLSVPSSTSSGTAQGAPQPQAATTRQIAAFTAASQAGQSSSGSVSLFA